MKDQKHERLSDKILEVISDALDRSLGSFATTSSMPQIRDAADLLAERYLAKGRDCCIGCGWLTQTWHPIDQQFRMCPECQNLNRAIQQIKEVKEEEE